MANWYKNTNVTWGKDDIVDLLKEYDPLWEEHYYVPGETIYLFGRRGDVHVFIYKNETAVYYGNPAVPVWYEDPIVAILEAMKGENNVDQGRAYKSRLVSSGV